MSGTRLTMTEYRAAALYGWLCSPESRCLTKADVYLRLCDRWSQASIDDALHYLATVTGQVAEGTMGELIIGPNAWKDAA